MTEDDIMLMALDAGPLTQGPFKEWCKRFANLIAAYKAEVITAEAYRCGYKNGMESAAVVCENLAEQQDKDVRDECAAAIRARGEQA
jgi:hypothetical protein